MQGSSHRKHSRLGRGTCEVDSKQQMNFARLDRILDEEQKFMSYPNLDGVQKVFCLVLTLRSGLPQRR